MTCAHAATSSGETADARDKEANDERLRRRTDAVDVDRASLRPPRPGRIHARKAGAQEALQDRATLVRDALLRTWPVDGHASPSLRGRAIPDRFRHRDDERRRGR